jgi:hypothetical protein
LRRRPIRAKFIFNGALEADFLPYGPLSGVIQERLCGPYLDSDPDGTLENGIAISWSFATAPAG